MYAELQCLVEQSQAELVELIATRQREAERHAQELARGLESDLSHLRKRNEELEALAQNQDKVIFLQVGYNTTRRYIHTETQRERPTRSFKPSGVTYLSKKYLSCFFRVSVLYFTIYIFGNFYFTTFVKKIMYFLLHTFALTPKSTF